MVHGQDISRWILMNNSFRSENHQMFDVDRTFLNEPKAKVTS